MGDAADDLLESGYYEGEEVSHPHCDKCGVNHDSYVQCHLVDEYGNYDTKFDF